MKKTILLLTVALFALLASCSKGNATPAVQADKQEQVPMVKIETIQELELQLYANVNGRLEGVVDMILYSEVSGKVQKVNTSLGRFVKKGDELAAVNSEDYKIALMQANSDLIAAEASFDAAKIKLEASTKLFEKEKVSKYELTNDKSALKKAEALLEGARANVEKAKKNYDNSRFIAPVSGYITQLNIKEGQLISNGQPVVSIVNDEKLILKAGVGENDIMNIKNNNKVIIKHAQSGIELNGRVTGYGIKADNSGTYPVEMEIVNQGKKLLPGMIVEGKIQAAMLNGKIYTDFDNILEEFGKYYLFTVNENSIAMKREITVGERISGKVMIKSGITIGEKIVNSGIDNLTNGVKVKIVAE